MIQSSTYPSCYFQCHISGVIKLTRNLPPVDIQIFLNEQQFQHSKVQLRERSFSTYFYFLVSQKVFRWHWLIETTVENLLGIFNSFSIFSDPVKMFCFSEYLLLVSGHSTHEKCVFKISSDLFIHLGSYHLDSTKANISHFPLSFLYVSHLQ